MSVSRSTVSSAISSLAMTTTVSAMSAAVSRPAVTDVGAVLEGISAAGAISSVSTAISSLAVSAAVPRPGRSLTLGVDLGVAADELAVAALAVSAAVSGDVFRVDVLHAVLAAAPGVVRLHLGVALGVSSIAVGGGDCHTHGEHDELHVALLGCWADRELSTVPQSARSTSKYRHMPRGVVQS